MDAVTIRSAGAGDVPRLVELLRLGALGQDGEDASDPDPYVAALAEIESTPGSDVLVAVVDDEVVGMCQLIVMRHLHNRGGRCAELESVHVHPDLRDRGIGTRLVTEAVRTARDAGCYRVQLTSNRRRTDAHRFYERVGFQATHVGFKLLL